MVGMWRQKRIVVGLPPSVILFASSLSACWGGDSPAGPPASLPSATQPSTPVSNPTRTPLPSKLTFQPVAARTGTEAIDAVIAAVAATDSDVLTSRLRYSEVSCALNPMGIGSPPKCPEGVAAGSPLTLLPFGLCEEHLADASEVSERLGAALADRPRLYAVYEPPPAPLPGQPIHPDYVVLFGFQEQQPSGIFRLYMTRDGAITALSLCTQGTLMAPEVARFILPPK